MTMPIILGLVFVFLMLLSVPIGVCLGITALVGMLVGGLPIEYIAKTAYTSIDSFAIIAVPMFILAGAIMEKVVSLRGLLIFPDRLSEIFQVDWLLLQ